MIVNFSLTDHKIEVIKEKGDKRYSRGYALPESGFLYDVMQALKKQGYDVIKKRMAKDGHMMDDLQQYIRTRKTSGNDSFCIYNCMWATYDLGEEYNKMKAGDSMIKELRVDYL